MGYSLKGYAFKRSAKTNKDGFRLSISLKKDWIKFSLKGCKLSLHFTIRLCNLYSSKKRLDKEIIMASKKTFRSIISQKKAN